MVKADVSPFIKDTMELDIWSNDYFLQLADMIKFEYVPSLAPLFHHAPIRRDPRIEIIRTIMDIINSPSV